MQDAGFDFHGIERRDTPRQFEPPPWETEAAGEPGEASAAAAAREHNTRVSAQESELTESERRQDSDAPDVASPSRKTVSEAALIEWIARLRLAEEPAVPQGYYRVALAVGIALMAFGGMMLAWGMAAFVAARRAGALGVVAGMGLAAFGVFFFALGAWLIYRTLRQRGVL